MSGEQAGRDPAEAAPAPNEFLTVDEAAELLRINRKTLYDAVKINQVPGVVHVGRVIRIHRGALLSWCSGNSSRALGESR